MTRSRSPGSGFSEGDGVRPPASARGLSGRRTLHAIFQASTHVAIVVTDDRGTIRHLNAGAERMLGYSAAEAVGVLPAIQLLVPSELQARSDLLGRRLGYAREAAAAEAGCEYRDSREWTLVRKDGTHVPVHLSLASVRDAAGRITGFMGMATELTAYKRVMEGLRLHERQLRQIIDLVPHAIFAQDVNGRYVLANKACADGHGTTVERMIGRAPVELGVPVAEAQRMQALNDEVLRSGMPKVAPEESSGDAGGRGRLMSSSRIPFAFSGSALPAVLTVTIDLTPRKLAEEQRLGLERQLLQRQNLEHLGTLMHGMAHDYGRMLRQVMESLEKVERLVGEAPAAAHLEQAMRAARQASELTSHMLSFAVRDDTHATPVDLSGLVSGSVSLFRSRIPHCVAVELDLDHHLPPIVADAAQLHRVVVNLATNAVEAIGDRPGRVTLRTGLHACDTAYLHRSRASQKPPPGQYVYLEVADDGCGMSGETLHRVFEPFFTTKKNGRGLGLATVQGIVGACGGAILLDTAAGRGTTVRVLLPPAEPAASPSAPAA